MKERNMGLKNFSQITLITLSSLLRSDVANGSPVHNQDNEHISYNYNNEQPTNTKRSHLKVYHRFEEIPEVSDEEAFLYNKGEYTYIINADKYYNTGSIELKRVLTSEITQVNALSLIYRSECGDYIPKENEDKIKRYKIDFKLINPTGNFFGPSQMNSVALTSFIKYIAINKETRDFVKPLLKYKPSTQNKKKSDKTPDKTLDEALDELYKLCYDNNGNLRSMDDRSQILQNNIYLSITLDPNAWSQIASPQLKKYISNAEAKRKKTLSIAAKSYFCLTELFPNEELLQKALECYNLAFFSLGRIGKPKQIMMTLALSLNLKDKNGNLDASRIPLYAIAASLSHINWHGNGRQALQQAQGLKTIFKQNIKNKNMLLQKTIKQWVCGKSRRYGVDEISKLNMITPTMIHQYQQMELAGADNLAKNYQKLVEQAEQKLQKQSIQILPQMTGPHR